jgi:hypothetical protein
MNKLIGPVLAALAVCLLGCAARAGDASVTGTFAGQRPEDNLPMVVLAVAVDADGTATLHAATPAPSARAAAVSGFVTQVTGVAISPLLGLGAVGAWEYFQTEDKSNLSWYAQPLFWALALGLAALVAAKDAFGAAVPTGWKKPLDVADAVENKVTALLATGTFLPIAVMQVSKMLATGAGDAALMMPAEAGGVMPPAFIDWSPLLAILLFPLTAMVFLSVWLLSHAINVLILISPFGPVDAALKAARTSVMGLLAVTSMINPWMGALISLVIVVLALLLAGWAFRLTVFGTVFSWDFITLRGMRSRGVSVDPRSNRAFAGKRLAGVPNRTLGNLNVADDGSIVFRFRPWLVGKAKEIPVPTENTILGKGMLHPVITQVETAMDKPKHLITFPPRFRGREEGLQAVYRISQIREVGLLRGWRWLMETLGFGPSERPAVPPPPASVAG